MFFKTRQEKKAFRIGLISGLKKSKPKTMKKQIPKYLGPTYVNGKFYDTNFKKPILINQKQLKEIKEQYNLSGNRTDAECVDAYVNHMRRKYGAFDKNGKFLGLLGE